MKPASLFLVDSICKNVREPYIGSFIKHGLVSAMVRVIGEMSLLREDEITRDLMRVLPTWKGLFPQAVLDELNHKLQPYLTGQQPSAAPIPSNPHSSTRKWTPGTEKLLADLLAVFERPPGPHISGIVGEILKRLAKSGELKGETMYELDSKARLADKTAVIGCLKNLTRPEQRDLVDGSGSKPETEIPLNFTLPFELPDLSALSSILPSILLPPAMPAADANAPVVDALHLHDPSLACFKLENQELAIPRPNLYNIIYSDLKLQCQNCALRYRDTPEGQAALSAHLDSHFRRNMRLKEKSKKVLARDWFCGSKEWIEGGTVDASATVDADDVNEKHVLAFQEDVSTAALDRKRKLDDQDDKNIFRVPAGEDELNSSSATCSVCHEPLVVEWMEDEQQWMYTGAVQLPHSDNPSASGVVHKHCAPAEEIQKRLASQIKKPTRKSNRKM